MIQEIHLKTAVSKATVLTFGATLKELIVFNRNVVLSLDTLHDYSTLSGSFGATCGRVGNRIKHGKLELNEKTYQLELNQDNKHHRHGGFTGFSKRNWQIIQQSEDSVTLKLHSPDGEGGYPGTLDVTCKYTLQDTTIRIDYTGVSEQDTVINLLHHSYFNLGGDVSHHKLQINTDYYTPLDKDNIPTGEISRTINTVYDFQTMRDIGDFPYDINFIVKGEGFRQLATLSHQTLSLEVFSDQPGLQFYDGHMLNTPAHKARSGICLEPQRLPDTPNNPQFGSAVLKKGDIYQQQTEYRFKQQSS
jgi:aldose 1-epimerase